MITLLLILVTVPLTISVFSCAETDKWQFGAIFLFCFFSFVLLSLYGIIKWDIKGGSKAFIYEITTYCKNKEKEEDQKNCLDSLNKLI